VFRVVLRIAVHKAVRTRQRTTTTTAGSRYSRRRTHAQLLLHQAILLLQQLQTPTFRFLLLLGRRLCGFRGCRRANRSSP
jgi:hypothetical protein